MSCLLVPLLVAMCGCSDRPSPLRHPYIQAQNAAREAISQYDTDGDKLLSEKELEACPGILNALPDIDSDGDRMVSEAEISARISTWQGDSTVLVFPRVHVRVGKKPLVGARVDLIPEPFLAPYLKPGSGTVGKTGMAAISMPEADPPGMACGIYKVRVTHPSQSIPAKFNEQTILGLEITAGTGTTWTPIIFQIETGQKND